VFNWAVCDAADEVKVCEWETPEIRKAAKMHDKLKRRIRRLAAVFGAKRPAVIGENVIIECHRLFESDDKPEIIRKMAEKSS
jgi:hypothetical protein